jgi:hypothetical protein
VQILKRKAENDENHTTGLNFFKTAEIEQNGRLVTVKGVTVA